MFIIVACHQAPLHVAAINNSSDVVNSLIKHDADLNIKDKALNNNHNLTKFRSIVFHGVEFLISYETPLFKAFDKKYLSIAVDLIDNGADINIKNNVIF